MRKILLLILIVSLTSCNSIRGIFGERDGRLEVDPIYVNIPDSLPDPAPANGWQFVRTSPVAGVLLPPPAAPKKIKIKNSNNTKAKGEAIIGDNNTNQDAKKSTIIEGDGNTVTPPKEKPSAWWVWFIIIPVLAWVFWKPIKTAAKLILPI